MKRVLCLFLLLCLTVTILTACSSDSETPDPSQQTTGPALYLYGVTAEVLEIIEDGYCRVQVSGEDDNFGKGTILFVSYNGIRTNTSPSEEVDEPLQIGDIIGITYELYEETDSQYEITVPYVTLHN